MGAAPAPPSAPQPPAGASVPPTTTVDARAIELARLNEEARAPATDVRLAPSSNGVLGAWLVAGPFKASRPALDVPPVGLPDDKNLSPTLNGVVGTGRELRGGKKRAPATWKLVSSGPPPSGTGGQDPGLEGSRSIDLKAMLEDTDGSDLVAYAAGRLHVERAGKYFLMLGVDDGVRVTVDGTVVLSRDAARPLRDDDDTLALDLAPGDHDVVLKFHQRSGAWVFRAKFVDATLAPPAGAYLALPGTTADDARALAARMSWLIVDRAFDPISSPPRYRPVLTVRYPEGAPRGVPIPVTAKLTGTTSASTFDVNAGGVTVDASGVSDLVVSLPPLDPWTGTATLESTVAGRAVKSTFVARPQSEQALVRVERALARVRGDESWLASGSLDSVRHLAARLARFIARGDADGEAQAEEARELHRLSANLESSRDPYAGRSGMMRRALVTPLDGAPSEFGLYVPPSYKTATSRKYPLTVGLHGLNSYPMSMMRALFGLDDDKKEPAWKDRHLPSPSDRSAGAPVLQDIDAFVITPYAHGNTMYREMGEDDVLFIMRWMMSTFPIDETRITITGPSMGGIGSASIPFHYPHVFAAAAPLCGYHSYLIRPETAAMPKRPWERILLEERSNVYWAENGEHLPLWIVHGTRDLPEANSGVLIERYEKLRYSIKHEHPDLGHNVWGITYGDLKGLKWLLSQRLDPHPSHVRFRTMRTRYATSAWVTIDELATESSWGDIDATVKSRSALTLKTSGVAALTLARDPKLVDARGPVTVTADGTRLTFEEGEVLALHKAPGGAWEKGPATHERPVKSGRVSGPIRDVFHEPLLFVYGSEEDARVNERVARAFAKRPGVSVSYPVMSDAEFLAKNEPLAHDRALFLVGRANKVLKALDLASSTSPTPFPIHVEAGSVAVGPHRFTGRELGAAFIHPHPLRSDRYVVVVAGADTMGMLRALSLPDLIPDFVVWDEALAPARGQIIIGAGFVRAGGFFKMDWSLPSAIVDPLAGSA
ncbi:MAG TPA: hypothetical protein VM580_29410, partial [Labilithrix sp.]|nr:hypothetical protein [Labilithrix sp.]